MDRGLVANQVCMAKLPWKEPLRLCLVTRVEAERLLGSRAQMAAVTILLSFILPPLPFLPALLASQLLLSPVAGNVFSWKGGEDFQATHCLLPCRRGRDGALALGMTFSAQPPLTPSWYRPLLIQLARFGWGVRDSANGDSCKMAATCWLGPWPPLLFCLFCCFGGRGSDSQFPGSDNRTFQCSHR